MSRPLRLFGPKQLTNAAATQYSAPAAGVTVSITQVVVLNTTSTARRFYMSIGTDAAATRIFDDEIPANGHLDWGGKITLNPLEAVQAYAAANTALTVTCNGIEE